MDAAIIPECYGDTCLIETLVPPQKRYNHQKGCPNVVKVMREKFGDAFSVGIIDDDKRGIDYAVEFNLIAELQGQLKLLKHPQKHHYLIYICPALERWTLNCAAGANVNLADLGLPNDIEKLKNYAKRQMDKGDIEYKGLKELFRHLESRNVEGIIKLKNWISYLKQNTYKADIKTLKNL